MHANTHSHTMSWERVAEVAKVTGKVQTERKRGLMLEGRHTGGGRHTEGRGEKAMSHGLFHLQQRQR